MITLSFVALLVIWSAFVLVFLEYVLSRGVRQSFRDRGTQLVRVVTTESVPLVQYEEKLGLSQLFQRYMGTFPEMRYVAVMDADGSPVLSSFPDGIPGDLHRVEHSFEPGQEVSVRLIRAGGEQIYDYECRQADTLPFTFVWGQFIVGGGIALLLLGVAVLFPLGQRVRHWLAGVASFLVLLQVLCMRWNVVIGGQMLSKTGKGYHEFRLPWTGKEGMLAALGVFAASYVLLYVLCRILPPFEWKTAGGASEEGGATEARAAEKIEAAAKKLVEAECRDPKPGCCKEYDEIVLA